MPCKAHLIAYHTLIPRTSAVLSTKKYSIPVVDNDEEICRMLDGFHSRSGHIVKTINNGTEAIELARNEDFDLVLCDLAMPDVTGYDVIKTLNEQDKRPKIDIATGWG